MSTIPTDDDDMDTETIQAQIDLSMSFVHDLVSSWIKPSVKSTLPTRKDTEKEMQEYMRRPPRCDAFFSSVLMIFNVVLDWVLEPPYPTLCSRLEKQHV
jgi:hypothetical protein